MAIPLVVAIAVSDGVLFCADLFPTRCLGWDLGLNSVRPWEFSYLLLFVTFVSELRTDLFVCLDPNGIIFLLPDFHNKTFTKTMAIKINISRFHYKGWSLSNTNAFLE